MKKEIKIVVRNIIKFIVFKLISIKFDKRDNDKIAIINIDIVILFLLILQNNLNISVLIENLIIIYNVINIKYIKSTCSNKFSKEYVKYFDI